MFLPALLAAAAVLAVTACSGGGDSVDDATTVATSTATTAVAATTTVAPTTTVAVPAVITLTPTVSSAASFSAGDDGPITDQALIDELTNATVAYVKTATLAPLGGTESDVVALLTTEAAAALNDAGRDALSDDQMPIIVASPSSTMTLTISALTGPGDATTIAVVGLDVTVGGTTAGGASVSVHRTGDLTFAKSDAGWKIDAFTLNVDREMP
ncbi:MAG: hypothetical protein AB7V43_21725 [Acidimicrobiia bacterium]